MKKSKKGLKFFIFFFVTFLLLYFGIYWYAGKTDKLSIKGANGYFLYDINDEVYTTGSNEWAKLSDISSNLKNATISIEDKNFYKHQGFDIFRIVKALMINLKSKSNSQGASTITQQLSKNLFLNFDKTWSRMMKEAWITLRLETHYSKDKILEGYLNTINYGGIFGIEDASNYYFGKKSSDLSLAEASILAGIPKNPSKYSPLTNFEEAKKRQKLILNSMVKNGYISSSEGDNAYNEELIFKKGIDDNGLKMVMYYQDAVISELKNIKSIPSSFLQTGGLKIYTNLDNNVQRILEDSANKNISNPDIELSSVIVEPGTGKILALTGGRDYDKSEFNRATSSKRQVGSTIKPFFIILLWKMGLLLLLLLLVKKLLLVFLVGKLILLKIIMISMLVGRLV